MFVQHRVEAIDLGLETGSRRAKKDDTGMNKFFLENQLTEIAVSNNQNPPFFTSEPQNILISKTVRIITGDCLNVMTQIG